MNENIKAGLQTGLYAAAYGLAAEAANFVAKEGTLAGLSANFGPTWSLGAAGATAVVVDKVAVKALAWLTAQVTKAVPQTNSLLNNKWTQLALRAGVDAAAAAAVSVAVFGVAFEVAALAPVLLVGALPAVYSAVRA